MRGVLIGLAIWLSGLASAGALLLARDLWRGRGPLPPATPRQIRRAERAARLPLPALYEHEPEPPPQPEETP